MKVWDDVMCVVVFIMGYILMNFLFGLMFWGYVCFEDVFYGFVLFCLCVFVFLGFSLRFNK